MAFAAWDPERTLTNLQENTGKIASRFHVAITKQACYANNCLDLRGLLSCWQTDPVFSTYLSEKRFFQHNEAGLPMQRMIPIVVGTQTSSNEEDLGSEAAPTVQTVVTLIATNAYKAFQNFARQHPHCLKTFCNKNCLIVNRIPKQYVDRCAKTFSHAIVPVKIRGRIYSASRLRDMDNDTIQKLSNDYLLDGVNSVITGQCLAGNQDGSIMRMLCTQCAETLKDTVSRTNIACTSFDPKTEVALTTSDKDDNALYQQQLREAAQKQQESMTKALRFINNPAASIDIPALTNQLNSAVEQIAMERKQAQTIYATASTTYNLRIR